MNRSRNYLMLVFTLATAALLWSCGNPLEGGSTPSGSIIRVVSVSPITVEPDIYLTLCPNDEYEDGLTNTYVAVTLKNESRPNTPEGQSTNSYVTMNRYRVDYASLNMTAPIKSLDGGGFSVGLLPDGTPATMTIVVMDLATLEYIRSRYPTVGQGDDLIVRADITVWGEDAFKVSVRAKFSITMVITEYDRC